MYFEKIPGRIQIGISKTGAIWQWIYKPELLWRPIADADVAVAHLGDVVSEPMGEEAGAIIGDQEGWLDQGATERSASARARSMPWDTSAAE